MTYSTTLTSKGQVTVPVAIRRRLKLGTGERVRFKITHSNRVLIEKDDWKRKLERLRKKVTAHLKKHNIPALSNRELDQAINAAAEEAAIARYRRAME